LQLDALRYFKGSAAEPLRPRPPKADSPPSSHELGRNNLTTGTFNLLSKTESAIRLSGALSVELAIHADDVSSKLVHLVRSSPTRRDEPFKLTAAIQHVSIFARAKCDYLSPRSVIAKIRSHFVISDWVISIAKSRNQKVRRNAGLLKIQFSEVIATCKTLQSRAPPI
jgi:hypothetical protein